MSSTINFILKVFINYLWSYWFITFIFSIMSMWCGMSMILPFPKRLPLTFFIIPACCRIIVRIGTFSSLKIIDFRQGPKIQGANLVIVNHQSFMDIPIFYSVHKTVSLMKKEVMRIPFINFMSLAVNHVKVDRKDKDNRRKAYMECVRRLKAGQQLIYYPEGTRSKTPRPKSVDDIHRPLLITAFENNIPVTPVCIHGTRGSIDSWGLFRPFSRYTIITENNIYPADFKDQNDFVNFCWNKIIQHFDELESRSNGTRG